jgi:putative peptide zinc metalloprotease protein
MHVAAGAVIARVESPDLAFQQIEAKADRQRIEIRSRRLAADDETRSERIVLENELSSITDRIAALGRLEQEQALVAPVSGVVRNVAANLGANVWIGPNQRIALIVSDNKPMLEAYLSEGNRQRVETGARATFYPEEPEISPIAARLVWVAPADTLTIANRELADIHGGPIPTIPDSQDGVMPQGTWYPVRFLTENGEPPDQSVRGTLHIEAESRSIAGRILRRIAGVLIRESGF